MLKLDAWSVALNPRRAVILTWYWPDLDLILTWCNAAYVQMVYLLSNYCWLVGRQCQPVSDLVFLSVMSSSSVFARGRAPGDTYSKFIIVSYSSKLYYPNSQIKESFSSSSEFDAYRSPASKFPDSSTKTTIVRWGNGIYCKLSCQIMAPGSHPAAKMNISI